MTDFARMRALKRQCDMGMVMMGADGRYALTIAGRDFLDDLALLMELDNRDGAARESAPWRTARPTRPAAAVTPSEGQRAGDDGGPRRSQRAAHRSR